MHNVIELDVLTYDGLRMTVGATDDASHAAHPRRAADGAPRSTGACTTLADDNAAEIRRRFPDIPRRVSGYNLPRLLPENGFNLAQALVGTEGTCVVILEARLRLLDWPPARSLLVLGYPSVLRSGGPCDRGHGAGPIALEGIDDRLVKDMKATHIHPENLKLLPDGGGWLLVEFGGKDKAESDGHAKKLMAKLRAGRTRRP